LNSRILSFLNENKKLLEVLEDVEDVAFDEELDKDILDSDFFYSFLESGIGEDDIVAVAINEQNVFVLDLGMTTRDASVLEVLPLVAVAEFNLANSVFLVLPLG
jgi:hypothetical protein